MSTPMEGLRQLVASKNWDYCILWKLSEDQSFLEFMDCCCCGSEGNNIENGTNDEDLLFTCRDGMFAHPRTSTCEILSQFPSSQHLDGINMEILMSSQPRWLSFSNVSDDSNVSEESLGTKVLIPIPGGLAELYAAKQVAEDFNVIDYVMAQCNVLAEQGQMSNSTNTVPSYSMNMVNELESTMNETQAQITTLTNATEGGTLNFCDGTDFSMNNFLQQFNYASENGSFQANHHHHQHGLDNSEIGFQGGAEKCSLQKQDVGRVGSVSESEQLDDDEEDEPKYRRRGAKGPQAKNLWAERKRRKKLNERLYILRSLVPNISKLDKAAILVDAIAYVKELQKEAEDLQDELNRNSDDEGTSHNIMTNLPHNNFSAQVSNVNAPLFGQDYDHNNPTNGFRMAENESLKSNCDLENANDKGQQMEVQVEVGQLEGNDFYVKVFGEHKKGGIVRLMEALNALGLEITNVNMTSCISLVSYVFIVKKRDSENFHAEYLRDSLMEATRNCQAGYWTEMEKPSESGDGIDHRHHQHLRLNHQLQTFHNHFHHISN